MQYSLSNQLGRFSGGLDPAAKAYIAASGATDANAINNFVKGIKALGLWNDMICWPMRSTQNAGTGSTAYSLGGYGTYNGTLVNVPTWGGTGITCTHGSSQSINVTVPFSAPISTMIVYRSDMTAGAAGITSIFNGSSSDIPRHVVSSALSASWRSAWTASGQIYFYSQGEFNSFFGYGSVGTQRGRLNGSASNSWATTSGNAAPSGNYQKVLGLDTLTGASGTITGAMTAFFFGEDIDTQAVYSLYKSTLGTGLSLP
jgi:hypothetical protein